MLFKILHGDKSRISTDITPYHEGYCYVTHDGDFYVDMDGKRIKLNAKDAETLSGTSIDSILASALEAAKTYTDTHNTSTSAHNDIRGLITDLAASVDQNVGDLWDEFSQYTNSNPLTKSTLILGFSDGTSTTKTIYTGPTIITFTIGSTQFNCEDGMTWNEFINSDFNNGDVAYDPDIMCVHYNFQEIKDVGLGDFILANHTYVPGAHIPQ